MDAIEKGRDLDPTFRPDRRELALLFIDPQQGVLGAMPEDVRLQVVRNMMLLIEAARLMYIPLMVTEEYPKGLGRTLPEIREKLGDLYRPFEKTAFSCCGSGSFVSQLEGLSVRHLALTGSEAHVCVLQTAMDLLARGYHVSIISDAVCSRYKSDWEAGLRMMEWAGACVTTAEILVFQLLGEAATTEFKHMSPFIKER